MQDDGAEEEQEEGAEPGAPEVEVRHLIVIMLGTAFCKLKIKNAPLPQVSEADKRTLRVNVACMSRAGREPGFKKTNQDNCFAFEKYITEDQSLFGAMDGHGPHGMWL